MYVKNDELIFENIDNDLIIFDAKSKRAYELEDIEQIIWGQLECLSVPDIVALLCESYDVDFGTAEADVKSFINRLLADKLIAKRVDD